jgi:hypothetical protein
LSQSGDALTIAVLISFCIGERWSGTSVALGASIVPYGPAREVLVRIKSPVAMFCAALLVAFAVRSASAQPHRGRINAIPRSPLLFGGFYPHSVGFGAWYPQPYPVFGFLPPFLLPGDPTVTLRFLVTPRDAGVFVDGFAAGSVDDFDGVFQRLRVVPGPHEIVVHHPGYRSFRQNRYFNPGSNHTIRHTMDPLGPGEAAEPPPVPHAMPLPAAPPQAAPPPPPPTP